MLLVVVLVTKSKYSLLKYIFILVNQSNIELQ